jgi:cobyrinic acid a,c-diamide synthase
LTAARVPEAEAVPAELAAIPRLVIAGVASGVGKTTVTVALARALRARGLRVALCKCGPDYLDPTYHARAIAGASHNLDGWMMGKDAVRATFLAAARAADVALIEGVMGLYDGASATGEEGSTAEIARWLDAPVLLVFDASGMARSAAALVAGFAAFDPALRLVGALGNRVGSRGHAELLAKAMTALPLLGALPREASASFPARHLGLRTADEQCAPDALLDRWAELAEEWLPIERLLARASAPAAAPNSSTSPTAPTTTPATSATSPTATSATSATSRPPRARIGVARDAAFHFYYVDNLRRLEELGAELVELSPLGDRALPDVDGVLLGGGYPELFAAELASNRELGEALRGFAARGGPIYAECGGFMYLCAALTTADGARFPMLGLFPEEVTMHDKLQALGYVEVETQAPSLLGPRGTRFRGHQFRYSSAARPAAAPPRTDEEALYSLRRRRAGVTEREGFRAGPRGNVVASYVHAHWASNPQVAASLVAACVEFRRSVSG